MGRRRGREGGGEDGTRVLGWLLAHRGTLRVYG